MNDPAEVTITMDPAMFARINAIAAEANLTPQQFYQRAINLCSYLMEEHLAGRSVYTGANGIADREWQIGADPLAESPTLWQAVKQLFRTKEAADE